MAHEQDGAGVDAEGVLEHVTARQVEVVGRLVEDQQVDRIAHRLGEGEPGPLATRQLTDLAFDGVAPEAERAEHGAVVAVLRLLADRRAELLLDGLGEVEGVDLVLGEVGDVDVVADLDGAFGGCEVAEDRLEHGRLAGTVGPDEGELVAPLDEERCVADHRRPAVVADRGTLHLDHDPGRTPGFGEGEAQLEFLGLGDLDRLELLEGLDARLHLA